MPVLILARPLQHLVRAVQRLSPATTFYRQPDRLREIGQADQPVANLALAALEHAGDRRHVPQVDLYRDRRLQVLRHRGGHLLNQFVFAHRILQVLVQFSIWTLTALAV